MNRENLKLLIVATVCLTAGWGGPTVASAAVSFAQNSDKVDGKHAVGAGASIAARKGKLVATNPTTGRLPNSIIAVAPDAAKLGGATAAAMRTMTVPTGSLVTAGPAASNDGFGPWFQTSASDSQFRTTFMVPPGHKAGASLIVNIAVWSAVTCDFRARVNVLAGGFILPGTTNTPATGDGFYQTPARADHPVLTFTVASIPEAPIVAGALVELEFTRQGSGAPGEQGTCTNIQIPGLQVRY